MKFRSYFLLSIVVGAAFACSSDDEIPEVQAFTPDATLSLTAGAGEKTTKANVVYDTSADATIYRLQMLVFSGQADDATYQTGKDSTLTVTDATSAKIEDLPVQSGNISLLVLANYPKINATSNTKLSDVLAMKTELEKEGISDGYQGFAMSSQVYKFTIAAGKHNIVGAENDFTSHLPQNKLNNGAPVKLIRNVAKVNLVKLTLKTKNADGSNYILPDGSKPVKFELDSIFVANVKSMSNVASSGEWGAVEAEMTGNAKWLFGAFNGENYNDTLSQVSGDQKNMLLYNVVDSIKNGKWTYDRTLTVQKQTISALTGLGKSFLVYENMNRSSVNEVPLGEQTILVVCGRYTRQFGDDAQVTEHGFYAVPINNKDFGAKTPEGVVDHEFVKRNVKYNISLTIASTGSSTPYGWDVYAHAAAKVEVMPWNVINIIEDVD